MIYAEVFQRSNSDISIEQEDVPASPEKKFTDMFEDKKTKGSFVEMASKSAKKVRFADEFDKSYSRGSFVESFINSNDSQKGYSIIKV